MFSTYQPKDVTILLKDITGLVKPLGTAEREAAIQSGVHYSEMLPLEYKPSEAYMAIYEQALQMYSQITADAVAVAAERIWNSPSRAARMTRPPLTCSAGSSWTAKPFLPAATPPHAAV